MFKPTTLLKVISILMIIFSVIGVIMTLFSMAIIPKLEGMPGMDTALLESAYSPASLAVSFISAAVSIAAGIVGASGKSKKVAVILMGVYTLITVISIIQSFMLLGALGASGILSLILPALYWWGLYQSE